MNDEYVRKDVHEAELESLIISINNANDRIDDLRNSVNERLDDIKQANSHSMTMLTIVLSVVQIAVAVVLYLLKS